MLISFPAIRSLLRIESELEDNDPKARNRGTVRGYAKVMDQFLASNSAPAIITGAGASGAEFSTKELRSGGDEKMTRGVVGTTDDVAAPGSTLILELCVCCDAPRVCTGRDRARHEDDEEGEEEEEHEETEEEAAVSASCLALRPGFTVAAPQRRP